MARIKITVQQHPQEYANRFGIYYRNLRDGQEIETRLNQMITAKRGMELGKETDRELTPEIAKFKVTIHLRTADLTNIPDFLITRLHVNQIDQNDNRGNN